MKMVALHKHTPTTISLPSLLLSSDASHEAPPKQRRRTHWLLWMGIGMCVMFAGWILLTMLNTWWTNQQNTWSYGYPRTYQTDQNVGHGTANDPISHFIAENLHGEIIVIEIPGDSPSKSK